MLERPTGCSVVSQLHLGSRLGAGQPVRRLMPWSRCKVTVAVTLPWIPTICRRGRDTSVRPSGAPLLLVAALWFCFGELPSINLLRSVVPDTLPSSGQAGPIRWVLPGFLTLGSGSWCCHSPSNASSTTSPSAELLTPYRQRKPLPPWSPKGPSSVHHSHLSVLLPFHFHQLGCS